MAPADAEEDDHRVEPDQRRGLHLVEAAQPRRLPDQGDEDEARDRRDRLVGEDFGGDPQRHEQVAERGEKRAVHGRGGDPLDPDQRMERFQREGARPVQVWVGAVHGADPRVGGVAEDVAGEERRREEDHRVEDEDRGDHGAG